MWATAPEALNTVYNIACGNSITLNQLFSAMREALAAFDPAIGRIEMSCQYERIRIKP